MSKQDLLSTWTTSPFSFGGAAISGEGGGYGFGKTVDHAQELLDFAYDQGVRIFDTAPIYGFGQSENILGEHFKKTRDQVKIVSKSGVYWHDNKRVDMTNDPKITAQMLEDSLRRLQSDYIDLYMIHWPDGKTDIRYPMEVLAKAKNAGKIKHIGLCNTFPEDVAAASEVGEIEVIQCEHSIFHGPSDELTTLIKDKNISFMGWGTFDKGILTGRVTKKREQAKNYDEDDCRKSAPWWQQKVVIEKCEKVEKLKPLADELELSLTGLALRYLYSHEWHTSTLLGAKSILDWKDALSVDHKGLEADILAEINKLCRS